MKSFLLAVTAALVIAAVAGYGLNTLPDDSEHVFSTTAVRL